jgi:hypothetical protein
MSDGTKCPTCEDLLPEYCPAHPQPVEPAPGVEGALPWTHEPGDDDDGGFELIDASGAHVGMTVRKETAAFIVRAVNASQRESALWDRVNELAERVVERVEHRDSEGRRVVTWRPAPVGQGGVAWIPVGERLPDVGKYVNVVHCGVVQLQAWMWDGETWSCSEDEVEAAPRLTFSHWMPLPAAPGTTPPAAEPGEKT